MWGHFTLFKLFSNRAKIDSSSLALTTVLSASLFFTCAIINLFETHVGDPMLCNQEGMGPNDAFLSSYCWSKATFTFPNRPGIRSRDGQLSLMGMESPVEGEPIRLHLYYKWVVVVLTLQAVCFLFPKLLLEYCDVGKQLEFFHGLTTATLPSTAQELGNRIADSLLSELNQQNSFVFWFFFGECLTLVHVVLQFFVTDKFLDGEFWAYGANALRYRDQDPENGIDPMSRALPITANCLFVNFGSSIDYPSLQTHDVHCNLPINSVNQMIFLVLWFWYIIMMVLTGMVLLCRIVTLVSPKVRLWLLLTKVGDRKKDRARLVFHHCQIGDWFVLMQISANVKKWLFEGVIDRLADRVNSTHLDAEESA